ncbi:MAG: DUF488 domain-containing protein [Actinobacteria bacterium]|nr:DUF488 domain-containing protein [Actinomycetota bacterium]MDI6831477.1 DUF488 domain-containing protein [Actinomycetota bacterium]
MEKTVFTLGTSTRGLDEFIDLLRARGISRVCDVRSFPVSRRYPHFSRQPLASALEEAGIAYSWLGDRLGGYRKGGYEAHMRTPEFLSGLEELEELAQRATCALICAELLPWKCHRRHIAAALQERGWRVVHVIDARRDWVPS